MVMTLITLLPIAVFVMSLFVPERPTTPRQEAFQRTES
jgi:hypothetical protein